MKYFRVKPEADNRKRYTIDKNGRRVTDSSIWVGRELYTEKELSRFVGWEAIVEPVEVSKRNIYWAFGARFECSPV